jgi:glyoxalase superfamily protein
VPRASIMDAQVCLPPTAPVKRRRPLRFNRQPKSQTIEVPIHLDISVPDHEAERERVLRLGGGPVEVKSFRIGDVADTFTIMRDPEGNGFCLESLANPERARVRTVTFASAQRARAPDEAVRGARAAALRDDRQSRDVAG